MFKSWLRGYELTLDLFLKYKSVVLIAMIGTLIGTVWLYILFQRAFSRLKIPASSTPRRKVRQTYLQGNV